MKKEWKPVLLTDGLRGWLFLLSILNLDEFVAGCDPKTVSLNDGRIVVNVQTPENRDLFGVPSFGKFRFNESSVEQYVAV